MKHLPDSLEVKLLRQAYSFSFDPDNEKDEGLLFAFNRNLEIVFKTFQQSSITLNQRGPCYDGLISMVKRVVKEAEPVERDSPNGHLHRWLERLISAAERAGAKIPGNRYLLIVVNLSVEYLKADKTRTRTTNEEDSTQDNGNPRKKPKTAPGPIIDLVSDSEAEGPDSSSTGTVAAPHASSRTDRAATPSFFASPTKQATLFHFGAKTVSAEEARQQTRRVTEMLGTDYATEAGACSRGQEKGSEEREGKGVEPSQPTQTATIPCKSSSRKGNIHVTIFNHKRTRPYR